MYGLDKTTPPTHTLPPGRRKPAPVVSGPRPCIILSAPTRFPSLPDAVTPLPPIPTFYSVFNAGCSALLGTINAEQFEREIMRQNPAAPDVPNDHDQGDEFVWVDHPGMQRAAAAAAAAAGNADDAINLDSDDSDGGDLNSDDGEADSGGENDGGADGAGADAGARGGEPARGQGRKVSGKRARRGFEERRERREERRLALQALVQDEWN